MTKVDEITLVLPRDRAFYGIANLVLGGLAIRFRATIEKVDDLQIALESVLEQEDGDEEITVHARVAGDTLETRIGPFSEAVARELAGPGEAGLGLRRILDTVTDSVSVGTEDGRYWIELRKMLAPTNGESR